MHESFLSGPKGSPFEGLEMPRTFAKGESNFPYVDRNGDPASPPESRTARPRQVEKKRSREDEVLEKVDRSVERYGKKPTFRNKKLLFAAFELAADIGMRFTFDKK